MKTIFLNMHLAEAFFGMFTIAPQEIHLNNPYLMVHASKLPTLDVGLHRISAQWMSERSTVHHIEPVSFSSSKNHFEPIFFFSCGTFENIEKGDELLVLAEGWDVGTPRRAEGGVKISSIKFMSNIMRKLIDIVVQKSKLKNLTKDLERRCG